MPATRWQVTPDSIRIERIDGDGNVIETRPTRYGTLTLARAAARQANRELKAGE